MIKKIVSIIFAIALLTGCTQQTSEPYKLKNVHRDGSFVLTKDLKVSKEFSNDMTIRQFEWYTDPYCGDCIRTHQNTEEYLRDAIAKGEVEIKFHPLNYLPHRTDNDYSLQMSAWIVGVAEEAPEKIMDFMHLVYSKDVRDNFKAIEYENVHKEIALLAEGIVGKEKADFILKNVEVYENAVNRGSVGIRKFEKWKELSPNEDGSFFVPFIYNANSGEKALLGEEENTEEYVLKPLQGIVDCQTECE